VKSAEKTALAPSPIINFMAGAFVGGTVLGCCSAFEHALRACGGAMKLWKRLSRT
jgi:hypothetical protein